MQESKPLILVVEDDRIIGIVAIRNLQRVVDAEVRLARNGFEAIEQVKRHDFALILMDVHMPLLDGLEATRQIRAWQKERGQHTPIVAVTASDTREHCLEAGMDDFINKPADYIRVAQRWLGEEHLKLG